MSSYEVSRVVGMRALQLDEGAQSNVVVENRALALDTIYIASLELYLDKLDACLVRGGEHVHVSTLKKPSSLRTCLDIKDGEKRSYAVTFVSERYSL